MLLVDPNSAKGSPAVYRRWLKAEPVTALFVARRSPAIASVDCRLRRLIPGII